jgi:hypothetical protein
MIRRDYILRMIEECLQALARIKSLKREQRWKDADDSLDTEFQKLVGAGAQAVARLSETELLARLMQGDSTQILREKTFILTALLQEAGDVAAAQDQGDEARVCYLKALHLLLDTVTRGGDGEFPEFVPKVEALMAALHEAPLPAPTQVLLMQHFERTGQFAKAEDALFALLESAADNPHVAGFGAAFYRRLLGLSDESLAAGNLPRAEVEEGLRSLECR